MELTQQVLQLLDDVLGLGGRAAAFTRSSHLLGALPELDSMAVVSLIAAIEAHFDVVIDDDDIDGETFATVGALTDLVAGKLRQPSAG